jgi:hypothetical protein
MSKSIPSLASKTHLSVIAILTVLALLALPVCAPLCAAKACSSNTSSEHCHAMASMAADSGEHLIAPTKSCGPSDFSAILVKTNEQAMDSQGARSAFSAKIPGLQAAGSQPVPFSNSLLGPAHQIPLASANSLQLTSVLRI